MGTLIFSTSSVSSEKEWHSRYLPWLMHHATIGLHADAMILIDDGSEYVPIGIPIISADDIGTKTLSAHAMVRFATRFHDADHSNWWRSFLFALTIAEAYGLDRIVHIDSDVRLLSPRSVAQINQVGSGWVEFDSPRFPNNRSMLQVACRDSFDALRVLRAKGPFAAKFFEDVRALLQLDTILPEDYAPSPGGSARITQLDLVSQDPGVAATPLAGPSLRPLDVATASVDVLTAADQLRETAPAAALVSLAELRNQFPRDDAVIARLGVAAYIVDQDQIARDALEEAVALAPANFLAQKFLGATRMRQGHPMAAIAALRDAVRLNPADSGAQSMLGAFLMQGEQFAEAAPVLLRALELDPADASAFNNIAALPWSEPTFAQDYPEGHAGMIEQVRGFLLVRLRENRLTQDQAMLLVTLRARNGRDFKVLLELARVIAREPQADAQTRFNLGAIFALAGDLPATLDCYQRAFALAPQSYRIRNAIGYQQICCGAHAFGDGFAIANETWPLINPDAYATDTPTWKGENLSGREIFVYQEQGSGDAILSLRLLPLISGRGGKVVLWTRPELADYARNAPGVSRFVDAAERPSSSLHRCGVAIPLLGAITALGVGPREIRTPTVLPLLTQADGFAAWLHAAKLKVGLCVLGNPMRGDDWTRSIPANFFARLAQLGDVQWVNLSVDHRPEQQLLRESLPEMLDLTHELTSFAKTAALIAQLDVVLSIDAVVAHIAASVGKPVLLLAPPTPDWRWQIADDLHPWWPSVEVLRAITPQAFDDPINRASALLAEMAARKRLR